MKLYFMFLVYFFGCTTWLAVPPPGFKLRAPEGRTLSPNHWAAGQFPEKCILKVHKHLCVMACLLKNEPASYDVVRG